MGWAQPTAWLVTRAGFEIDREILRLAGVHSDSSLYGLWAGVLKAAEGILVLAATLLVARLARRLTRLVMGDVRIDVQLVLLASRVVYLGVAIGGLFGFLFVVAPGLLTPVLGAVGLLGLAVGLAFQDVLKNFLSGVFLLLERPFRIGDEIKVGEFAGTVETILLRVTVLKSADGLKILLPNQQVYTSAIVNSTGYPERQFTAAVRVPEGAQAVRLVDAVGRELSQVEGVAAEPPPAVTVLPHPESGATIEVRYWVDYQQHDPARVQRQVNSVLLNLTGASRRATPRRASP